MSDRLDPQFRDKLGKFEVPYNPADWASLQARLDAPTRRRRSLLWLGMPAAAVVLGVSAFFLWPNNSGERARQAAGQGPLESAQGSSAFEAPTQNSAVAGVAPGTDHAGVSGSGATAGVTPAADHAGVSGSGATAGAALAQGGSAGTERSVRPALDQNKAAASRTNQTLNSAAAEAKEGINPLPGSVPEGSSNRSEQQATALREAKNEGAVQSNSQKLFPQPLHPMAAITDPTSPSDREWEKDPTLDRGRRLVDLALMGSVGLNAEYTAAGDGFRPGQDAGVGAELWFRSGVFLSAGLFYGQYHFHQNKVACGNPYTYGIKEPVHCPDALLGTQGRWEIPMQVGYGWDLARARGRFRVSAGVTAQRVRVENYDVEFHNTQPGVLLFYEPVTIAVTEAASENLSFDAYGLVESTNEYTVQTVGPSERVLSTKINGAAELALGYEQFLAPSFSLGVEPRIGVPFNKLVVTDGRAYYGGVSARLRWYPGLGGR